ncbi:bifunctional DedA family/phosphatase PAP2 family protein [Pseudomonas sp. ABC1]|uniref:bifunctional DedA family/phosphatase PAP2 family protein n=1 Tax=Pseudomonas sp. ABC1 TaxID=2748080 RepID=UPI0015C37C13|nr:bifunctional DedA family/phosphatase PAP2 family protein [Pseudomonas sp. ABC1]QLF92998.1 bifunctional DedA family/phosphatase PAP2 family protein [Pseudomonas sp. ABC1]
MGQWLDTLTTWLATHPEWLGIVLFVAACIECLAIVGLLVPGTVLLFTIAMLAGGGALTLLQTLLLGYAGGLLGDLLSYALGRRYHQGIKRLPVLRNHPQWLIRAEHYFANYGVASLLVGRFIGPLRPMLPMTAGMLDMPFIRFLLVSLVSSAGWSVAYLMPGWSAGAALHLPLPEGFWADTAVIAVILLVMIGGIVHGSLRQMRWASVLSSLLAMLALAGLFIGWPHFHAFDQGLLAVTQDERHPLLDHLMMVITRFGDFHAQLLVAILLCLLLLALRQWRALLFAGSTLLGTALGNAAFKAFFARTRPEVLIDPLQTFSFPSGHSSASFAFFLALGVLAGRGQPPRMRLTWLLLASLPAAVIASSRVYLGVHWPTDVIAGALLASSACAISLVLVQWRTPLQPLSARTWTIILPTCLLLLCTYTAWTSPGNQQLYRYEAVEQPPQVSGDRLEKAHP